MKLLGFILLTLPVAAADTAKVTATGNDGGGGTITTHNEIIMVDEHSAEILEIHGVDDLVDRAPTPTPSPTPTLDPKSATVPLSYMCNVGSIVWPRYRRPEHPDVIKVDVWTADGKHWRATRWEEVKP